MVSTMRGETQYALELGTHRWTLTWDFFVNMWLKVLRGWEEMDKCTLPKVEARQLIDALVTMQQTTVL